MKIRFLATAISLLLIITLVSCGGSEKKGSEEPETYEVALITGPAGIDDGSFLSTTWDSIESFALEYQLTSKYYNSEKDDDDSYMNAVKTAVEQGAGIVFLPGSAYETVAHRAQGEYKDIDFVLIDGVPRDEEHNYELAANSTGVLFAEEEAGFLAGYAAVTEGYRDLGFIGGRDVPSVQRYGLGFLQGIATSAEDNNIRDIRLKYSYTDTFEAEDWIQSGAEKWYKDGTSVIFACGGSIGSSVIKAAEKTGNKVIGVDTDQSTLSDTVITSAKKNIKTAVYDIMKTYIHDNFKGNSIFNYNIENDGIGLEMTNSRLEKFSQANYDRLLDQIKSGERKILKETGDKTLGDIAGKSVSVSEEKIEKQ